jgi:hypothetical protein
MRVLVILLALAAVAGAGFDPALDRAVRVGDVATVQARLAAGANANARDGAGRTLLMEAAEAGQMEAAKLLISAGADLNASARGFGTALEMAERSGHTDFAAMLLQAGARSTGKSVGDKVCVRPWKGDGYCGTVEAVAKNTIRIKLTDVVGCEKGCPARGECSAGKPVGGPDGWRVGDVVGTVTSCLTQTGVRP